MPELLTVSEVAAYLRVSKALVYRDWCFWADQFGIKPIRIGRHLKWRKRDIETLIDHLIVTI